MNKNRLKSYAPRTRKDFIRIVEERAALLGLNPGAQAVIETEGDVTQINGRAYPRNYGELHRKLSEAAKLVSNFYKGENSLLFFEIMK